MVEHTTLVLWVNGLIMLGDKSVETDLQWDGRQWIVTLLVGGRAVCDMTLDEWTKLGATRVAIDEALESRDAAQNWFGERSPG